MNGKWIDDTNKDKENPVAPQWRQLDLVSGSAALTEKYIDNIQKEVRSDKIVVIDLRDECHGAVGGIPISYTPEKNEPGSTRTILNAEERLAELNVLLSQNPINLYKEKNENQENEKIAQQIPKNSTVESIASICKRKNVAYERLPVKDHHIPDPQIVDNFLEICEKYPNHHKHIHCRGGKGRTTMFLLMHAMQHDTQWKQGELLESFINRHQGTGKVQKLLKDHRSRFLNDIYEYMHNRRFEGETQPFTEWHRVNGTSTTHAAAPEQSHINPEDVSSAPPLRRPLARPDEEAPRIGEPVEAGDTFFTKLKRAVCCRY